MNHRTVLSLCAVLLAACASPDEAPDLSLEPVCDPAVDVLSAEDVADGTAYTAWRDGALTERWSLTSDGVLSLPDELASLMVQLDAEQPTQLYQREVAQADGSCPSVTSAADRAMLPELGGAMGLSCSLWAEAPGDVSWRLRCPMPGSQAPLDTWLGIVLEDQGLSPDVLPGLLLFVDGQGAEGRFELRLDSDGINLPANLVASGSVRLSGVAE